MKPVREHPLPVKRKCYELFLQRYSTAEIARRTGVCRGTQFRWSSEEGWGERRASITLNLDEVAKELVVDTLRTLSDGVRVASKILNRIETYLDATDVSQVPRNEFVQSKLNAVPPEALAQLAASLRDASEILLRVFSK